MKKLSGISEMALASLFTALLSVCAIITVPAPIPFTLQTFALFLIAGLLPLRSAFPCVLAYIMLGAAGLPVFSGFGAGFGVLLGPTGGYILGFVLFMLVQKLVYRITAKKQLLLSLVIGLIACYICGIAWYLIYSPSETLLSAVAVTLLPFIIPDAVKLFFAMLIIKRIRKIYDK